MDTISKREVIKETIFDIAIEMIFIAFVLLVPIVFDRRVGIVFSLTKVTFMRILTIALISIWIIKGLLKNEHKFPRSPLDWPVLSYMLLCTVAMINSVHPITSFMGFYGRYEGLSTLWMYGFLYFVTFNFIRRMDQMKRVFYTVIIAAICMSMYSMIQRAGLDPYAWGGVVTWQRVIGTIGQPNFLAAYVDMAFIIGLAVLVNITIKDFKDKNIQMLYRIGINASLIIGLALIYTCILYTQSRGGFLGLFAGISLFLSLINRDIIIRNWKKLAVLFAVIFGISFVTMLDPTFSPIARMSYEAGRIEESHKQETPIIKYSAALSRLETWKSGYKIMTAYPVFGIGQEVLKMIFPQFETEYFRFFEGFHVKQDRMHNEICDMAVTRGILTLTVYVWLLATFFWMGKKVLCSDKDDELKLFVAAMLGASVAYLIQNQFSFGVVAMTTLLWIMMGLTASIYVSEPIVEKKEYRFDLSKFPWLYISLIFVVAVFIGYISMIQFRADMHFKYGKVLSDSRRFSDAVGELERSIKISPYEGGTWTHLGITYLNYAQESRRAELLDRSIGIFKMANRIDPYNADNFYILGRAYLIKSMVGQLPLSDVLDVEENAVKIDPRYAEAYQVRGMVYERTGDYTKAFDMYKKALEINPSLSDATAGLLNVSSRKGNYNDVIKIFKEFLVKYPDNLLYLENLALAYIRIDNVNKAIETYSEMLQVDPKNMRALNNLGFLYAKQGKTDKARDLFDQAIMVDPKNIDAHNGLGLVYLQMGNASRAKEEFNQSLTIDPNNQYAKQMLGGIK